jgi:hypothetical protein
MWERIKVYDQNKCNQSNPDVTFWDLKGSVYSLIMMFYIIKRHRIVVFILDQQLERSLLVAILSLLRKLLILMKRSPHRSWDVKVVSIVWFINLISRLQMKHTIANSYRSSIDYRLFLIMLHVTYGSILKKISRIHRKILL